MSEVISLASVDIAYTDAVGHTHRLLHVPYWSAQQGDWWMLLGPSGSGKTSMLNVMAAQGKAMAHSGTVALYYDRAAMAYVPQQACLMEQMGVRENLLMLHILKQGYCADENDLSALADRFGVRSLLSQSVLNLSGGERMKIALMRALLLQPQVLFLDEPSSQWDVQTTHDMMRLLSEYHHQYRMTIVMVTHDVDLLDYATHSLDVRQYQPHIERV